MFIYIFISPDEGMKTKIHAINFLPFLSFFMDLMQWKKSSTRGLTLILRKKSQ